MMQLDEYAAKQADARHVLQRYKSDSSHDMGECCCLFSVAWFVLHTRNYRFCNLLLKCRIKPQLAILAWGLYYFKFCVPKLHRGKSARWGSCKADGAGSQEAEQDACSLAPFQPLKLTNPTIILSKTLHYAITFLAAAVTAWSNTLILSYSCTRYS